MADRCAKCKLPIPREGMSPIGKPLCACGLRIVIDKDSLPMDARHIIERLVWMLEQSTWIDIEDCANNHYKAKGDGYTTLLGYEMDKNEDLGNANRWLKEKNGK